MNAGTRWPVVASTHETGSDRLKITDVGCWAFGGDAWWGPQDDHDSVEVLAAAVDGIPDLDVVVAEVGVELRLGMELMAVPASGPSATRPRGLIDPELGKPLRHHVEVARETGPGGDPGQPRLEIELELHRLSREDLEREIDEWNAHVLVYGHTHVAQHVPIGVVGDRARVGRPPEALLELLD